MLCVGEGMFVCVISPWLMELGSLVAAPLGYQINFQIFLLVKSKLTVTKNVFFFMEQQFAATTL